MTEHNINTDDADGCDGDDDADVDADTLAVMFTTSTNRRDVVRYFLRTLP